MVALIGLIIIAIPVTAFWIYTEGYSVNVSKK